MGAVRGFWCVLPGPMTASRADGASSRVGSLASFRRQNASGSGLSRFMALKAHFGGGPWTAWPPQFRSWTPQLTRPWRKPVRRDADRHAFYSTSVFGPMGTAAPLRRSQGVASSATCRYLSRVRQRGHLAEPRGSSGSTKTGSPLAVAGGSPRLFLRDGPALGNPLYDWTTWPGPAMPGGLTAARGFELYDIIRLDHFRGFDTYWEVPAGAPDAGMGAGGRAGAAFFDVVRDALPSAGSSRRIWAISAGCGGAAPGRRSAGHEDPAVRLRP